MSQNDAIFEKFTQMLDFAESHSLFDYKWYVDHYSPNCSTREEAFADYLNKSWYAPVNPSPNFNNLEYLRSNPDVLLENNNSLIHYLFFGREEGRFKFPVDTRELCGLQREEVSAPAKKLKVVACLHIFYEEYIDKFLTAVEAFPIKLDVLISVCSEGAAQAARNRLKKIKNVGSSIVEVFPNQGRNFGPMLTTFSRKILKYDLLIHLHSKKSLYSGKTQDKWSNYLAEYLIENKFWVTRLVNEFAAKKDLGIYYPSTFWTMPSWSNHVLKNRYYLEQYREKYRLSELDDFISYPVGGMFWARPAAIKQLFLENYKVEDFPTEPIPNDGTILHAIERVLVPLTEKNGFKKTVLDVKNGHLKDNFSTISDEYRKDIDWLKSKVFNVECVSFDVFDTLVKRKYTFPDYAKILLGKELSENGYVTNSMDFVNLRNDVELQIRREKNFLGDVSIFEVYERIAVKLGLDVGHSKFLADREFNFDLDMIEGKTEIVCLLNDLYSSGKKIWVITDTYYSKSQIGAILKKAGVAAIFQILASSDLNARKDNGSMWQYVKKKILEDNIVSHVHIGDSATSDAQNASDAGINNIHLLNPFDKWKMMGFPMPFSRNEHDEKVILKWGGLLDKVGRWPFLPLRG